MISIAVVDDMDLFRSMFVEQLRKIEGVRIWRDFSNGKLFTEALSTSENYPDIVFLDMRMPEMDGIEVCKWIRDNDIPTKIIMLSQFDYQDFILSTAQLGASSFLLKNVRLKELEDAIKEVYQEGYYFSKWYTPATLTEMVSKKYIEPKIPSGEPLTEREMEITKLICKEIPYKEIANTLGITLSTVDELKTRAMKKVGAKKVTGLVIHAAYMGWV